MRKTIALGLVLAINMLFTSGLRAKAPSLAETPLPASGYVDAVGVTAHWDRDTGVYAKSGGVAHGDQLAQLLVDLGVHHYRTKAVENSEFDQRVLGLRAANHGTGPQGDFIIDIRREMGSLPMGMPHAVGGVNHTRVLLTGEDAVTAIDRLLEHLNNKLAPSIAFIEGPNEYDTSHHPIDTAWDKTLAQFVRDIDAEKKALPQLRDIPFVAPSMGNVHHAQDPYSAMYYKNVGVTFQFANSHGYPRGEVPTNQLVLGAETAQTVAGPIPIFHTETGYNNALGGRGQPGVPEAVAAKYGPRLVAEELRTQEPGVDNEIKPGIQYMNFYELSDEAIAKGDDEGGFGLIRLQKTADGKGSEVVPKPIYFAIQRTLRYLQDTGTRRDPLTYSLSCKDCGDEFHHLLLQKRDGSYYLLLWLNVVAKAEGSTNTGVAEIRVPASQFQSMSSFEPSSDRSVSLSDATHGVVSVPVGDELVIVRMVPK